MANSTPLWKQLLGAGVGSAVAVALYMGYQSTEPLRAYLLPPGYQKAASSIGTGTGVRLATKELLEREKRLNARAAGVAERLQRYREGQGMVAAVAPIKATHASSSMHASSEASSMQTSERHQLPPAPAGAWVEPVWSSEDPVWSSQGAWQTSSAAWVAAVSARSTTAKYANPEALPSSGAAMTLAIVAGIGGIVGLAALRLRRGTLAA